MASKCTSRAHLPRLVTPALDLNFPKHMYLLKFGLHVYWNYYGGESPAAIATLWFNLFQVQSPFFLFNIDWELTGVRTLWAKVANLAFLKANCENLAFLTCLAFFSKTKKAGRNLAFSAFFEMFGFISNIKKTRRNLFFSGFFLDIFQNKNVRICSLRQCDPLIGSVMWQLPYVTVVVSSSVVAGSTMLMMFVHGTSAWTRVYIYVWRVVRVLA